MKKRVKYIGRGTGSAYLDNIYSIFGISPESYICYSTKDGIKFQNQSDIYLEVGNWIDTKGQEIFHRSWEASEESTR